MGKVRDLVDLRKFTKTGHGYELNVTEETTQRMGARNVYDWMRKPEVKDWLYPKQGRYSSQTFDGTVRFVFALESDYIEAKMMW